MRPTPYGIGAAVRRTEDPNLVTGHGRYTADFDQAGSAHAVIVRSPAAHARFTLQGVEDARAMPGILGVFTAQDLTALGPLPCQGLAPNSDGSMPPVPDYPILPRDTVRYVGEAVAMVVAETLGAARDAADTIYLETQDLPVVVDMEKALQPETPPIWPAFGGNLAFDNHVGDAQAVQAGFERAHRVIKLRLENNRIVTNYLEPRGALGSYDTQTGRYKLILGSQGVHLIRPVLAKNVFKLPEERFHIVTPDVGGGFGTKYFAYREYALVLFAAERLGCPVRWIGERTEHFLADYHGRDNVSYVELALDEDARFLAMRVDTIANMGAMLSHFGPYIPVVGAMMLPGIYRTPALYVRLRGAYTNTVPVDAYRGAGRPEAAYLIERLVDKAALELGMTPEELRRRNFITPQEMPFTTPTGRVYDSGDFDQHLKAAKEQADWDGFSNRAAEARSRGRLRGIGMATYIEACSGGGSEHARVVLDETGGATIYVGTQSSGQGHHTAYAQLASQHLGIAPEKINVVQGDSDLIKRGAGSGGSRSIPVGGTSVFNASERLAVRLKQRAADQLEAGVPDIELSDGTARVIGTDRSVMLATLVAAMPEQDRADEEDWTPHAPTFPNGTHIAEVEVDPETGAVRLERYTVVDDFGITLNPLLLEGQIHGGVAQGIGQALLERTVYDQDSGQLLTASLMDYCLPRADDLPMISFDTRNIACTTNILGIKGAGEAGAIGACPALVNAICNALHRDYGISHVDMPVTPQRLWQAIREAKQAAA